VWRRALLFKSLSANQPPSPLTPLCLTSPPPPPANTLVPRSRPSRITPPPADGIVGEFVCGAYTLSWSGPPERAGQPVRTDFSRQSDVRAPFVVVTSPRRAVTVGVSSSSSSCARFLSFPFVFLRWNFSVPIPPPVFVDRTHFGRFPYGLVLMTIV